MLTHNNLEAIRDRYGKEYLLRQLAEECGELNVAALHLIRTERKETKLTKEEVVDNLIEEIADVIVMIDCVLRTVLPRDGRVLVNRTIEAKCHRMVSNLLGGEDDA